MFYILSFMGHDQKPTTVDVEGFLTNPPSPDQVQERGYEAQVWITRTLDNRVVSVRICYGAPVQGQADWRIDDNDKRSLATDPELGW